MAMKLTERRLLVLKKFADSGGLWINNTATRMDPPKWMLDQFDVASELVRLALIGAKAEARHAQPG